MERNFGIDYRHSVGNLHVSITGEFNSMCAWELIKTIKLKHRGPGRIFVNTAGLQSILSDGAGLFKLHMKKRLMREDWLYFKGSKGFKIAPDGSRVLICRKNQKEIKNEKSTDYLRNNNR